MKYVLLLFTLLGAGLPAAAQTQLKLPKQHGWVNPLPTDSLTGKVSFRAVVQVPGATQAQLYTRAKQWFATTSGPVKPIISQADEAGGILSGKASELVMQNLLGANVQVPLWRTITIQVKPGRFRYIITDFAFDSGQGQGAVTPIENYLAPNALTFDANGYPRPVLQSTIDAIYRSGRQQASSVRQRVSGKVADDNW
ncbi:DUF4468 domain-containing protein [Hymenobacter sp. UV11]|uniref:DUF4468 domain-containing protein n=1 Tax=Hymenobacter sp. UV11 TaxID=1849735 RepID=UPI00105FE792|nr:DUF4468 domain-containing protein [Hymenobacter sp. UV11]TDN38290.1 hypothetical protein A8B98_25145 [Hymenobacter sp. UV11]TFZ67525.1 DUF4468 domain-containing protein [Hymenobacter sp. UV11]